VLWAPGSAGLNVRERGLEALSDPRILKISIANPELAPYGKAAELVLRKAGLWEPLKGKLVRAENVGQAAQFVQSGAAQIGLFAYSMTLDPAMAIDSDPWLVPADLHEPVLQSGVILPWTTNRLGAEALRDFLLSPAGGAILTRHGFSLPQTGP
jgi:molybdate transport system substrate-binding protein